MSNPFVSGDVVWRDDVTKDVPSSGRHRPEKPEIRQWARWVETNTGATISRGTLAQLEAVTPALGTFPRGEVLSGEDAGWYWWDGAEWQSGRGFPDTVATVTLSGDGTHQTGVVISGVNPADVEMFKAFVTTPNTGPMTLAVAGEAARDVLNVAGNPLSAGEWTGVVLFVEDGDDYRLIIDAGAAASAAQSASEAAGSASSAATSAGDADDAATRAETAAAGVEFPISYGASQILDATQREQARQNMHAVGYDEQPLENGQRAQARENVHSVGYDEQTLSDDEQAIARGNIGSDYSKLAKLMAPLRKITSYDHAKHKAFGITDVMPSGRVVCAYREGTNHASSVGIVRVIYSDDGGLTWSAPATIGTATGDLRNLAGGVTANGMFVIAADEWNTVTPGQNYVRFYKSTDGATFTEFAPTNAGGTFGPMSRRMAPYGKIVNRPDGSAYIPVYIGTSSPSSSSEDFDVRIIETEDDFATIKGGTVPYIFDKSVQGTTQTPTETTIIAVSETQHVAISRRNAAPGNPNPSSNTPYIFLSTNAGATWSAITNINALAVGSAPPLLWFHEETDTIYLFWPLRGTEYYQNADINNLGKWSWYYSYITRSALFSGGAWRPQMQLPIDVPNRALDGDSGYQHIYEAHGSVFMTFYMGGNNSGTDTFVANLSAIMGL